MSKGYVWSGAFHGIMTSFGIFYKNLKLVPFASLVVSMLTCKSRIVPEINSCSLSPSFEFSAVDVKEKSKQLMWGHKQLLEEELWAQTPAGPHQGLKKWWDHATCDENWCEVVWFDENYFLVQVIASFVGGDVEPLALSPSFLHISLPRTLARSSGFLIQRGRSYFSSRQRIMGLVYPSQRPLRQRLRSIARYFLIP